MASGNTSSDTLSILVDILKFLLPSVFVFAAGYFTVKKIP